jgi:hypothetical protein
VRIEAPAVATVAGYSNSPAPDAAALVFDSTERYAFVHNAPAAMGFLAAAGFDTALRAVLKTSPGLVLSEGPRIGPESKPGGRTIRAFMNSPG